LAIKPKGEAWRLGSWEVHHTLNIDDDVVEIGFGIDLGLVRGRVLGFPKMEASRVGIGQSHLLHKASHDAVSSAVSGGQQLGNSTARWFMDIGWIDDLSMVDELSSVHPAHSPFL
jgi:hypothetical protein